MITDAPATALLQRLPQELRTLYSEAREAYRTTAHRKALDLNRQLTREATACGDVLGQILGRRFEGLCHYRLSDMAASEEALRDALRLAEGAGEIAQQLLITNHLASTLRRAGKLGEAYERLRDARKRATLPTYLHPRARLIGNLGALYDEFGQRARADDCYARFEELAELIGNPHWLANARSLAARAAAERDDFELAEEKYRDERELAQRNGDVLHLIAATIHTARLAARRGRMDEAEDLFRDALDRSQRCNYEKRYIDALAGYAGFLREHRGNLSRANYYLGLAEAQAAREPEKRANIAHERALLGKEAGFLGESLHYLIESLDVRAALYEPLTRDDIKTMTRARIAELGKLTDEMVDEALRVKRSGTERERLKRVISRLGDPQTWERYEARRASYQGPPVETAKTQAESVARNWWHRRLTQPVFDAIAEPTREALIGAGTAYHSATDDLTRSAHLLALAVEEELRERVFTPAAARLTASRKRSRMSKTHQHFSDRRPWTLGSMLESLGEVVSGTKPAPGDVLPTFRRLLASQIPDVTRVTALLRPIVPLKGTARRLLDIRNESVHDAKVRFDRLEVDAIARAITLDITGPDEPTVMASLLRLRIP